MSMKVQLLYLLPLFGSGHRHYFQIQVRSRKTPTFDITLMTSVTIVKEVNANKGAQRCMIPSYLKNFAHNAINRFFLLFACRKLRNTTTGTALATSLNKRFARTL